MLKDPEDRAPGDHNPIIGWGAALIYSRGTEGSLVGRGGAWYVCCLLYGRLSAKFVIWMLTDVACISRGAL